MNHPTTPCHNRIALFFDFDETLGPKTDHVLLEQFGLDPDEFKQEQVEPLKAKGYENVLAKAWAMIQLSKRDERYRINQALLEKVAADYPLYPGVEQLFSRLRDLAREIVDDIEVEFHLLTAGFKEIPEATPIASEFDGIWGGQYEYDDDGNICFVKNIVAHPEKTRYVMMVAKGLEEDGANGPDDVWVPMPRHEWHVPLDQIIYVGDGNSDAQIFGYLYNKGGICLGVKQNGEGDWKAREDMHEGRAVENVAPADYEPGSELFESLALSVKSICHRIKLRKMSV